MLQLGKREITQEERKIAMVLSAIVTFLYALSLVTNATYGIYFILGTSTLTIAMAAYNKAKVSAVSVYLVMWTASLYLLISGIESSTFNTNMAYAVVFIKVVSSIGQFWILTGDKTLKI